jgi:radical SAM superfamily enzyme YgiQ (UPF0313 family)
MKILYIITQEIDESDYLAPIPICRISNYLNARKNEINHSIEEKLIDLRFEVPEFIPENIIDYREKLLHFLNSIYKIFPFDVAALSCYGSGCYLNTLEVANQIKSKINPQCIIIVGGPHATLCPDDFHASNIPKDFSYEENKTPFNYLIQGEGEKPFYKLIKNFVNNPREDEYQLSNKCKILRKDPIEDLDDLPILDMSLINKYKEYYFKGEALYIDFSRGCPYSCYFCINSSIQADNKYIRTKSIEKCLKELKILIREGYKKIHICDAIFLSKRGLRAQFFKKLKHLSYPLPRISVSDRIDFCSDQDLKNYAKHNIIPRFGLETISKTLIWRINKTSLKPEEYLKRFKEIVKFSNKVGLKAEFNIIINMPATDENCINQMREYLDNGSNSLIKAYFINFIFRIYYSVPNTYLYNNGEQDFGTIFLEKYWWKKPTQNQKLLSNLVIPSQNFSLKQSLLAYYSIIRDIINTQKAFDNSIYRSETLFFL